MLRALMANRSTFNCYEPLKLAQIADPGKPLVFGDAGVRVMDSVFTPNRIVVRIVGGPDTSRLFINQSYAPGWRSTLGEVTADQGKVMVLVGLANPPDSLQCLAIPNMAAEGVAAVGRIGNQSAVAQDLHRLADQSQLRILWVQFEILAQAANIRGPNK